MATYIILGRFSLHLLEEIHEFTQLTEMVMLKVKKECPGIVWKQSFATLGRFDVVDIIEADDPKMVEKTTILMRSHGYSTTEVLMASQWKDFFATLGQEPEQKTR